MENGVKKLSPAIFGIALICFFLPFVNVSCQGQKVASYTGIQLVTGTTIEEPSMFGQKQVREVSGEPLAILAFLSGIAGLGLSFLKSKKSAIGPAVVGIVGLISLLLLKSEMDDDILREGGGMLQIEYTAGFWLTFVLYLSAIGLNAFLFSQSKKEMKNAT
jgi:hypothetical protein